MRFGFLLSILPALYHVMDTAVVNLEGRQSGSNGTSGPVLTPDIAQLVQTALGIDPLAVAIVYINKRAEYGTWGIKFEIGTNMTNDVH
jgi:hypothetical protein